MRGPEVYKPAAQFRYLLEREPLPMYTASPQPTIATVLVVEDNELNLRLLEALLEIGGYATLTTGAGETALDIARAEQPDLILMDIQLPDISGIEAIRRLKSDEQTVAIPIIAVTAFAMSPDKSNILSAGCDAYITKPFRSAELLKLVRRYSDPRQGG
jgi:two-component system cell cycle response regulator DivK